MLYYTLLSNYHSILYVAKVCVKFVFLIMSLKYHSTRVLSWFPPVSPAESIFLFPDLKQTAGTTRCARLPLRKKYQFLLRRIMWPGLQRFTPWVTVFCEAMMLRPLGRACSCFDLSGLSTSYHMASKHLPIFSTMNMFWWDSCHSRP